MLLGVAFAFALFQIWDLETRWFLVAVAAICLVAGSVVISPVFSEVLMIGMFFSISLASFIKWLGTGSLREDDLGNYVYGGLMGVGVIDGMLLGLYLSWGFRIFVLREERLPRLILPDLIVLWFIFAELISIPGSISQLLGLHSVAYLLRFVAAYVYVSRHIKRHHLPWLLGAFCFTIIGESALGIVQHTTGKLLGIALDKGAGGDSLQYQYNVPGIEQYHRATGTCFDSHSLGLFLAMLIPFPAVMWLVPPRGSLTLSRRMMFASIAGLGTVGLVLTFSRSAWLGFAAAVLVGLAVMLWVWKEKQIWKWCGIGLIVALAASPVFFDYISDKLRSPEGLLTVRFQQYEDAWHLWERNLITGIGAGNAMEGQRKYIGLKTGAKILPIHNVILYIGCEMGVFGLIGFYGIIYLAMRRLWRIIRTQGNTMESRFALASWISLVAYSVEGMGTPMFREMNTFLLFWILVAISTALPKMHERTLSERSEQALPAPAT